MKIRKKEKTKEPEIASDAVIFGAGGFSVGESDSDFGVNVRNADAGIRLLDEKAARGPWWRRELPHEIATSVALMSIVIFLLAAAYLGSSIPFVFAGSVVYMGLVLLGTKDVRFKYYAAAAVFALLVVSMIVLRRYIGGGLAGIMNMVYDASEAEQAYIYDRFGTGAFEEQTELCLRAGVIWASALFGLLGALPSAPARRGLGLITAAAAMAAFAYYGLIPAAYCIAIAIVAILLVLARGGILATVPVLLISLLLFGAVMVIDPGENYGISRVDENIRDRLALRSAYLETDLDSAPEQKPEDIQNEERETEDEPYEYENEKSRLLPVLIALLITAALGAIIYLLYRRHSRRKAANREGIDAEDARTAIVSMFPYAVRWLGASEMDVQGKSFASLAEPLRTRVSEQYSKYYSSMYVLWREAAYSDHEMEEDKRTAMKEFVEDTKEMVRSGMDLRAKIKTAVKYAL